MVTYYDYKRTAIKEVDELARENTPLPMICYMIETRFGFPSGFVRKRLGLLEKNKFLTLDGERVIWTTSKPLDTEKPEQAEVNPEQEFERVIGLEKDAKVVKNEKPRR